MRARLCIGVLFFYSVENKQNPAAFTHGGVEKVFS